MLAKFSGDSPESARLSGSVCPGANLSHHEFGADSLERNSDMALEILAAVATPGGRRVLTLVELAQMHSLLAAHSETTPIKTLREFATELFQNHALEGFRASAELLGALSNIRLGHGSLSIIQIQKLLAKVQAIFGDHFDRASIPDEFKGILNLKLLSGRSMGIAEQSNLDHIRGVTVSNNEQLELVGMCGPLIENNIPIPSDWFRSPEIGVAEVRRLVEEMAIHGPDRIREDMICRINLSGELGYSNFKLFQELALHGQNSEECRHTSQVMLRVLSSAALSAQHKEMLQEWIDGCLELKIATAKSASDASIVSGLPGGIRGVFGYLDNQIATGKLDFISGQLRGAIAEVELAQQLTRLGHKVEALNAREYQGTRFYSSSVSHNRPVYREIDIVSSKGGVLYLVEVKSSPNAVLLSSNKPGDSQLNALSEVAKNYAADSGKAWSSVSPVLVIVNTDLDTEKQRRAWDGFKSALEDSLERTGVTPTVCDGKLKIIFKARQRDPR